MPSIAENLQHWGKDYDWPQDGDEWSKRWGSSLQLWNGTIIPRIYDIIDDSRNLRQCLEIAPGMGRCTEFLKDHVNSLKGIDVSEKCIAYLNERFTRSNCSFFTNDGKSLSDVPDGWASFVFSWDSLVHVEMDTLKAYFEQLRIKMTPNGIGFIHHSNIGEYKDSDTLTVPNPNWRATSVEADTLRAEMEKLGFSVICQEVIPWFGRAFTDCFTIFCNDPGLAFNGKRYNKSFTREVNNLEKIYRYSRFKKK